MIGDNFNMRSVRGRPGKINPAKMKEAILKYKDVINSNNNIVSKTHDIWNVIASELENKVTTNNLYVFTMCNRYNVKSGIFNQDVRTEKRSFEDSSALYNSEMWTEDSINCSLDNSNSEKHFVISLIRQDFTNLLTEKVYKRKINDKGKTYYRFRKILQPGKWQELITDRFWEATHMKCGFQFRNHYISADAKSGVINGKILYNYKIVINIYNIVIYQ